MIFNVAPQVRPPSFRAVRLHMAVIFNTSSAPHSPRLRAVRLHMAVIFNHIFNVHHGCWRAVRLHMAVIFNYVLRLLDKNERAVRLHMAVIFNCTRRVLYLIRRAVRLHMAVIFNRCHINFWTAREKNLFVQEKKRFFCHIRSRDGYFFCAFRLLLRVLFMLWWCFFQTEEATDHIHKVVVVSGFFNL